jgi:predicted porin
MNNTIKLAVASALLAAASSASAAGGIVAGDWTLDIGGVVNAYVTSTKAKTTKGSAGVSTNNITTGLLPNYLSVSGKTRQNDLDVAFTISIQPGASTTQAGIQGGTDPGLGANGSQENRQAFLTFGDASWGSIKLGKDLGIYASDAILNDMTLLGVGNGAGYLAGNTTTTGRIGNGYQYADWKAQAAYSSPNFNGFQFTVGVTQAWNATGTYASNDRGGKEPAFEGKASYSFAADAVTGKVWASALSQRVQGIGYRNAVAAVAPVAYSAGSTSEVLGVVASPAVAGTNATARAYDIGATVSAAGFGLTGYYFDGKGTGGRLQFANAFDSAGNKLNSDGYYVQTTYTLPGVNTKLGASYGESKVKAGTGVVSDESNMWTFGAYHPLTKHLNLVAEYSDEQTKSNNVQDSNSKTISAGAILFF